MSTTTIQVTVPAEYAEDFRAALVEEIVTEGGYVKTDRAALEGARERREATEIKEADLDNTMGLLNKDVQILANIGPTGDGPIDFETDDPSTAAHVYEAMVRELLRPKLDHALNVGPLDRCHVEETVLPLVERATWAATEAARLHALAGLTGQREES